MNAIVRIKYKDYEEPGNYLFFRHNTPLKKIKSIVDFYGFEPNELVSKKDSITKILFIDLLYNDLTSYDWDLKCFSGFYKKLKGNI